MPIRRSRITPRRFLHRYANANRYARSALTNVQRRGVFAHLRRDLEPDQGLEHGLAAPLLEAHDMLWRDELLGVARGEYDLCRGGPDAWSWDERRPVLGCCKDVSRGCLLGRRFVISRDRWRHGEIAQRRNHRLRRVGSDGPAGSEVEDVERLHLCKIAVRFGAIERYCDWRGKSGVGSTSKLARSLCNACKCGIMSAL